MPTSAGVRLPTVFIWLTLAQESHMYSIKCYANEKLYIALSAKVKLI